MKLMIYSIHLNNLNMIPQMKMPALNWQKKPKLKRVMYGT